ncbi:MAG TPA: hypothetical protein VHE61_22715 [Opitutaceae bacterium]|nr:hypothetical protein [Opitutaceae bacterium]
MNANPPANPRPSTAPALRHEKPRWSRTFAGVWRLTIPRYFTARHALVLTAVLAGVALIAILFLRGRNGPANYLGWTANFYFTFLVPVLAFVTGGGVIRDEMKSPTLDYILTRPVPKPAFVAFTFVAHSLAAEIEFLLAGAIFVAVGLCYRAPGLLAAIPSLLVAQAGLVAGFTAFGFLCGAVTARYVVVGLVYGAIIEIGVGQIPTELNRLSMTHQVKSMLQPILAGHGSQFSNGIELLAPAAMLSTIGVLLAFTVVSVVLAAVVYSLRELARVNE